MINDMERIVGFVGETRDEEKKLIPEKMDLKDIEGIKESERALGANKIVRFFLHRFCFCETSILLYTLGGILILLRFTLRTCIEMTFFCVVVRCGS